MSKIKKAIESTGVGFNKLPEKYQNKWSEYNTLIDEYEKVEDENTIEAKDMLAKILLLEDEIADKIYAIHKVSLERSERMKKIGAARKKGGGTVEPNPIVTEPNPPAPNPEPIVEPIIVTPEPVIEKKGGIGVWGWISAIGGTALLVTLGINVANGNLPNPFARIKNRW